jgi:outer membrane protein
MKKIIIIFLTLFCFQTLNTQENLIFFVNSALEKNPKINAERQNLKAIKQNINISKSEFLPSITLEGSKSSKETSKIVDQSGNQSSNTKRNTETRKISVDQKIFQGFQGYNNLKKSRLEFERANQEYKIIEQETISGSIASYFDLILKNKNKNFNLANVDLFERQVESDKARLQKGEITLTDLAQSESSLAGANASLIKSQTELVASMAEFERITGTVAPSNLNINTSISFSMPTNLTDALKLSSKNNPNLSIARINLAISEKELSVEKSKLSPSASLNYSVTENKDLSATIDEDEQETVKATISWPLIKGGKNYSTIKKFKYKKEQNKLLLADKESEVKTQTATSWSFYQSAESVLKSTASQLKAAEIANEGISLEYDSGNSRTTLELIQSRSLLLDARISYAIAEKDLVVSKLELLSQIGGLDLKALNIQ